VSDAQNALLDRIKQQEPLVSLYRARESITDPAALELLDSLILLVTKQLLKEHAKVAKNPG
jgi:hypothetical protein